MSKEATALEYQRQCGQRSSAPMSEHCREGLDGVLVLVKLRERARWDCPEPTHVFIWLKDWLSKNELIKQQSKMVVRVESVNTLEWKEMKGA